MNRLLALLFFCAAPAFGADYYVDNVNGSDAHDGRSREKAFLTIKQGVSVLEPGDRLVLTANEEPYHENLAMKDRAGEASRPIEIDGRGATLSGETRIPADQWRAEGAGLYSAEHPLKPFDLKRFYMIIDGKMNRMGRNSKGGGSADFKNVADLADYEWTWAEADKRLYVRLPRGKDPGSVRLAVPTSKCHSGVELEGNCRFLVIRNLTATFFPNDGFNIHHRCADIRFSNNRALFNGDDGISGHETCSFVVDGFYAEGNSTGICHIQDCVAVHRNVVLKRAAGIELLMQNKRNVFENVSVESTARDICRFQGEELEIRGMTIRYLDGKRNVDFSTPKRDIRHCRVLDNAKHPIFTIDRP
ncbi:MAG: right-handed parallel beta-helix repeat-containing protein [Candidatus Sumerlaeia bacterium]